MIITSNLHKLFIRITKFYAKTRGKLREDLNKVSRIFLIELQNPLKNKVILHAKPFASRTAYYY